jgi:hypothetical protein
MWDQLHDHAALPKISENLRVVWRRERPKSVGLFLAWALSAIQKTIFVKKSNEMKETGLR